MTVRLAIVAPPARWPGKLAHDACGQQGARDDGRCPMELRSPGLRHRNEEFP
jgi:hypothetical protein